MNKKVDDKWLKNLRDHMEDYTEPLPDGLWEELDGELNQPKVIPFWRRWPSIAAAVALVLIINGLLLSDWFAPQFEAKDMNMAAQLVEDVEDASADEPATASLQTADAEDVPDEEEQSRGTTEQPASSSEHAVNPSYEVRQQDQTLLAEAKVSEEVSHEDEAAIQAIGYEESNMEETGHEDKAPTESTVETKPYYGSSQRTRTVADAGYSLKRRDKSNTSIEVGLHTGGIPYGTSKQFEGMSRMASHQELAHKSPVIIMGNVNSKLTPYNRVLFSNRDKATTTDVKHRMPINVVASVKWHFTDNWALESGVSYTFLQSELHSGSDLYWEDTQKLHYVGIPIKVHRNLWSNSTIQLYASAGGMIEKCVSGSLESVYVTGNSTREKEQHSVHSHPFQWSLAAAVGGQVNLLSNLSLFVEPGIAYYFDDHSPLETIRKEHPCTFNLQFGLRFNVNK